MCGCVSLCVSVYLCLYVCLCVKLKEHCGCGSAEKFGQAVIQISGANRTVQSEDIITFALIRFKEVQDSVQLSL